MSVKLAVALIGVIVVSLMIFSCYMLVDNFLIQVKNMASATPNPFNVDVIIDEARTLMMLIMILLGTIALCSILLWLVFE